MALSKKELLEAWYKEYKKNKYFECHELPYFIGNVGCDYVCPYDFDCTCTINAYGKNKNVLKEYRKMILKEISKI